MEENMNQLNDEDLGNVVNEDISDENTQEQTEPTQTDGQDPEGSTGDR